MGGGGVYRLIRPQLRVGVDVVWGCRVSCFFFFFWEGRKIGDRFVEDRKALTMVIAAKGEEGCCCESFLPPWINTLSRNPFGISLILREGGGGWMVVR